MIIFYNRETKEIFGVIDGRAHDNPEKEMIRPEKLDIKLVGRYVVPWKQLYKERKIPVKKLFLKDKKTREVEERVVGFKKEKYPDGLAPDVSFADLILDFEFGKKKIYDYKVELDSKKKLIGFKKK